MPRSSSWRSTRDLNIVTRCAILDRDGCTCVYCGTVLEVRKAELDHVLSRKDGGPSTAENLVTCCGSCNRGKQHGNVKPSQRVHEALSRPLNRQRGRELARTHYPSRCKDRSFT